MAGFIPKHHAPPTPPAQDHYSLRANALHTHQEASLQDQQGYFDEASFIPAVPVSAYGSPQQARLLVNDSRLQYPYGYGSSDLSQYQELVHHGLGQRHPYLSPDHFARIPTPDASDSRGRSVRHPHQMAPSSYSPSPSPPKRRKAAKKDSVKKAKLEKPLSELTAHLEHIPIKDTEAWVNRSVEQRRKEVGEGGFVKRPSNSFILYRSAFADRCREFEKSNNHQDISSMAGASWAKESAAIRKQYEDWAKIERQNHQAAFPDYKFQPQTQEAKARKRKGKVDDDSFDDSDPNDLTYKVRGSTPGSGHSMRPKKWRRDIREPSYTPSLGSDGDWGSPGPYAAGMMNQSYYGAAIPSKPIPIPVAHNGYDSGFYHGAKYASARYADLGQMEDAMYQEFGGSMGAYDSQLLLPTPETSQEEFLDETSSNNGHLTFTAPTLDPELLAFNQRMPERIENLGSYPIGDYVGGDPNDFLVGDGQAEMLGKWDNLEVRPGQFE